MRLHHLKCSPKTITYCGTKTKTEADLPVVIDSSNISRDTLVKATLAARPLLMLVAHKLNILQTAGIPSFRRRKENTKMFY
jgi:hypothetical protein